MSSSIAAAVLSLCVWSALGVPGGQSQAQRSDALRTHGLDPTSSLESRVGKAPASVLKMFADAGLAAPTPHELTAVERRKLSAAFAALPPLHRRILGERLRSVSFLDGMPNTALTSTINPEEPYRLFDITIRAGALGESVSEFLTQKERTCFETAGSSLNVSVEAGSLDAISAYEPMKSALVRSRFDQLERFYADGRQASFTPPRSGSRSRVRTRTSIRTGNCAAGPRCRMPWT